MSQTKVQSGFITDNSVTAAKIADSNVTTAKIADSNITTAKIADSNVTTAKLDSIVAGALVPIGGIIMWSGSVATIPSSWRLCNGANGTPNLQDKFVIGAGSGYAVGANGGSKDAVVVDHTHTLGPLIWRRGADGAFQPGPQWGGGNRSDGGVNPTATTSGASGGESGIDKNLPPYYSLAFIMRVS
jgi:hypothetical protein